MNRLIRSWWQSVQLLKLAELQRFFLLTIKTVIRLTFLRLPFFGIMLSLSLAIIYVQLVGGIPAPAWILFALKGLESFYVFLALILVRSSVGVKDLPYIYGKLKWFFFFFLFYIITPLYIMPVLLLHFLFFLDTYGTVRGMFRSIYNVFTMILFNMPLFFAYWIVFLFFASINYGLFIVLFLPIILCVLWVIYTKRLFDDFSLYMIE